MKNKVVKYIMISALCVGMFFTGFATGAFYGQESIEPVTITQVEEVERLKRVEIPTEKVVTVEIIKVLPKEIETQLSDYEKELIAKVVTSEACYEDEIGKRLVVDTILNRLDDPNFPDTVSGVIYQSGQFYRANFIGTGCMEAVEKEIYERLDYDILWFASNGYQPYGEKAYQHGGHYFNRRAKK